MDRDIAYPPAVKEWVEEEALPQLIALGQSLYVNNVVGQDHRGVKRYVNRSLRFGPFETAELVLQGYEVMHMLRKSELETAVRGDVLPWNAMIAQLFGMAASNIQQGVCTA